MTPARKSSTRARQTLIQSLDDLQPDPLNANRGTDRGREALRRSLRTYGAGRSIVIDKRGRILGGHKTVEQAKHLGLPITVVPTTGETLVVVQRVDLDARTDPRAQALALADNRVAELDLDWDPAVLRQLEQAGVGASVNRRRPGPSCSRRTRFSSWRESMTSRGCWWIQPATVCRWSRPATSIHDRAQWVHDHLPNVGDGACCDPRCLRRTHVSGWRIRRRWGRLATAALDLAAPFGCRRRASARVAAPSRHDVDPRPRGAPDGERDRRPGPCAADCCWQRAGRLGACASLRGGSGHRDSLRAGTAAHGPRNSQIRLRPRGAERPAPCGHGRSIGGALLSCFRCARSDIRSCVLSGTRSLARPTARGGGCRQPGTGVIRAVEVTVQSAA